jgi:hypothetical protein
VLAYSSSRRNRAGFDLEQHCDLISLGFGPLQQGIDFFNQTGCVSLIYFKPMLSEERLGCQECSIDHVLYVHKKQQRKHAMRNLS